MYVVEAAAAIVHCTPVAIILEPVWSRQSLGLILINSSDAPFELNIDCHCSMIHWMGMDNPQSPASRASYDVAKTKRVRIDSVHSDAFQILWTKNVSPLGRLIIIIFFWY